MPQDRFINILLGSGGGRSSSVYHSEGIVHGDLRGVGILYSRLILPHFFFQENVLLDPSFHSQVADFGLTRTRSTSTFSLYFAAPELFGICLNCGLPTCTGCGEGGPNTGKKNTPNRPLCIRMPLLPSEFQLIIHSAADGGLQIYFDAIPFGGGLSQFHVMKHLAVGKRPERLETPRMEDDEWNLIQSCWHSIPSERPNFRDIVKAMTSIYACWWR